MGLWYEMGKRKWEGDGEERVVRGFECEIRMGIIPLLVALKNLFFDRGVHLARSFAHEILFH